MAVTWTIPSIIQRELRKRDIKNKRRTGINVEGDVDLRDTLGSRRNADEIEVAEELVVPDQLTLTLVNLDLDGILTVSGSGESLGLLCGDGSVARNKLCHDTAESLDTYEKKSVTRPELRQKMTYRGTRE